MIKAQTQYYFKEGTKIGQIVFICEMVSFQFRMVLDIMDGYKDMFAELRDSIKTRTPYTVAIENSDICIMYTGGDGGVMFANGGCHYDMIYQVSNAGSMIRCLEYILTTDVWDYPRPTPLGMWTTAINVVTDSLRHIGSLGAPLVSAMPSMPMLSLSSLTSNSVELLEPIQNGWTEPGNLYDEIDVD